jgi:uncharacterized protein YjiK
LIIKSFLSTFLVILSCQNTVSIANGDPNIPYSLNKPAKTYTVQQPILQEISGLTFSSNHKSLITLQDEAGILFWLNRDNGAIEKQITFKVDGGDFEDLATVGETIYVLRSKGVISAIENTEDEKNLKVTVFDKTPLQKTADTEGLCYDEKNNRLLITCKGATGDPFSRAIWSFDLKTKQYATTPVFEISLKQIQAYLNTQNVDKEEFKKFFEPTETEFNFGPSAIAIHPKTGDYYILSSVGKILLLTDTSGKIKGIEKLQKKIHAQPEGIIFDTDATFYISNEGKKEETPKIHVFLPK